MKKYLMTGVAALALCAGFTSCSHDEDFEPITQDQIDKAKYDQAFLAYVGGKIASNQDWGFSATPATSRITRAIQPSFNFPSDANASKFLADVPEGIELLAPGIGKANHYIDASYTGDLNVWGIGSADNGWVPEGGTLYVKGNCDFSNRSFYFAGNSELYLVKGATLTLGENNGSGNLQQNTKIYIAEGAKLIANGELKLNNGLHIYNHGTIETPKLSTNSNSVLYNVGTVKVTGKISVENTLSVIVNDGTITAADLNTAGSGKFENNNNVTISGTTFVNSNDNTWVNNGQYHTGNFLYNAASDEVINNCRLTVDENFNINLGDNPGNGNFKMDAGSGVVTKNFNGGGNWTGTYADTYSTFNGGPFYIYMGAGSVFKVTGTATMNATKANYGIYGPESGDYAVFQAKNIVAGKAGQGYEVTYGGNLAVVAESHFANGMSGQYPYIDFKGDAAIYAPEFNDGLPSINIASGTCNPGFNGGNEIIYDLRIWAEDLSAQEAGDFDFNDIVLDVKYDKNNATLCLRAAGGTLPLYIDGKTEWEVHKLFQVGEKVMVNTAPGKHKEHAPVVFKLGRGITNAAEANGIKLIVEKNGILQEMKAPKGEPSCKLAVDKDLDWLNERSSIKGTYEKFVPWANDNNPELSKWWE